MRLASSPPSSRSSGDVRSRGASRGGRAASASSSPVASASRAAVDAVVVARAMSSSRERDGGATMASSSLYCGLDFGTSSARMAVVDDRGALVHVSVAAYDAPDARLGLSTSWTSALWTLLTRLEDDVRRRIEAVAIDGTSGTALIVDGSNGEVLHAPYMYNDTFKEEVGRISALRAAASDVKHSVESASSAACKLSRWFNVDGEEEDKARARLLHHADWLAYQLHGKMGMSDFNNALKLGFDPAPGAESFPSWLSDAPFGYMLPAHVLAPGTSFGLIQDAVRERLELSRTCEVIAGTTDSVAAFVASKAVAEGECATSLGSTLALKLISADRVDDLSAGVYSHRLNGSWLVGGASNLGGWILRRFFTNDQLVELTREIESKSYVADKDYFEGVMLGFGLSVDEAAAIVEASRPSDDAQFVVNIFSSIANVEARCYERMRELGASSGATKVFSAGGGAQNVLWASMRSKAMGGIPVVRSDIDEAAYGAALLARQGRRRLDTYVP